GHLCFAATLIISINYGKLLCIPGNFHRCYRAYNTVVLGSDVREKTRSATALSTKQHNPNLPAAASRKHYTAPACNCPPPPVKCGQPASCLHASQLQQAAVIRGSHCVAAFGPCGIDAQAFSVNTNFA
ncbi:hypothetical protein DL89DRAFT_156994, partial [Linderina pennispora]